MPRHINLILLIRIRSGEIENEKNQNRTGFPHDSANHRVRCNGFLRESERDPIPPSAKSYVCVRAPKPTEPTAWQERRWSQTPKVSSNIDMVKSSKAATATAAELSSTSRRRASNDGRSIRRRSSGSQKRRDSAATAAVISHGATTTTATANQRRRSGSSNGGAGPGLSSTKPSSTSYAATVSASTAPAAGAGSGGAGRRGSTTDSGDHSRRAIRDAVRAHAPKEEGR